MRFLSRTPIRTFIVYPLLALLWELLLHGENFAPNLWFSPLLI
jgi:hypothetical protein